MYKKNKLRNIEVTVVPEIVLNYKVADKLVVIIDVFRATTTMVTAMANGVKEIKSCMEVEDAIAMQKRDFIVGGERNGKMVEGMDVDNSPLSFLNHKYQNKKLAISTTNGTKAIQASLKAKEIIIGSFVNLKAVNQYIACVDADVLLVCSGWKGKISTEDFMFAGALIANITDEFCLLDSAEIALAYYEKSKENYKEKLRNCEHAQRLKKLNKNDDIEFCIQQDVYNIIPKYNFLSKTFKI